MSNDAVYIDGVDLRELGVRPLADHENPGIAPTRDISMTIPGRNGAYDYGASLDVLFFNIQCVVPSTDRREMQEIIRKVKAVLLDSAGQPKTVKLIFGYEPDKFYWVRYSGSFPVNRISPVHGLLSLPLVAHDVQAHSVSSNTNVAWGSEDITFGNTTYKMGHSGDGRMTFTAPGTTAVTVAGDAVRPVLYVTGRGSNVQISIGGRTLILPNFTAGTRWVIDFGEYTVLRNNQLAIGEVGGPWMDMYLEPGMNDVTVTGTNLNMEVSFEFNDRFN